MTGEVHRLIEQCVQKGCTYRVTGKGHIVVRCPNGKSVTVPGTPSDWRSLLNIKSHLKKAGVSL
jgi:hypothetical protein